ncbi:LysR family transcriptional regulator [Tropicimonas sp. S265A]|uniref:LysR family transcriptional regulator n=1 Tax=Tropicimonas sp. S265A TaxID=3415134 RepID=UPI003C7A2E00
MIDKLEMFIALARAQHFGRAAESCGVTQPTLSAGIKQLEDQLGVQLVWRGARFQGLTPEGQRTLEWARRIVGDSRALRDEMRMAKTGLSGNLRIGVIPSALAYVPALTDPFLKRHPNARFTILSRSAEEIANGLDSLSLDAGITYLDAEPGPKMFGLPLYDEGYRVVARTDMLPPGASTLPWADLAELPLCLLTPEMQNRRFMDQHMAEAGVDVRPSVEANTVLVLMAHIRRGGVATILSDRTAMLLNGMEDLTVLPLVKPEAAHRVGLLSLKREPATPVLSALFAEARRIATV